MGCVFYHILVVYLLLRQYLFISVLAFLVEHKVSIHNYNTTTNLLCNKSIVVTLLIAALRQRKDQNKAWSNWPITVLHHSELL